MDQSSCQLHIIIDQIKTGCNWLQLVFYIVKLDVHNIYDIQSTPRVVVTHGGGPSLFTSLLSLLLVLVCCCCCPYQWHWPLIVWPWCTCHPPNEQWLISVGWVLHHPLSPLSCCRLPPCHPHCCCCPFLPIPIVVVFVHAGSFLAWCSPMLLASNTHDPPCEQLLAGVAVLHCPPPNLHGLLAGHRFRVESKWSPSCPHGLCGQSEWTQLGQLVQLIFHHKCNLSKSSLSSVGLSEIFNVHYSACKISCTEQGLNPRPLQT